MPIMTNAQIETIENELREKNKKLTALKFGLPPIGIKDYSFMNSDGGNSLLSEMFGTHSYLVLIHNMGKACKYCTMWANGFEGIFHHFHDKAGFVMINHDSVAVQKEFAGKQGWTFPIYSAAENSFSRDLGFADEKNNLHPGVSTFQKITNNKIELIAQASFGPGDNFCNVWHFYDMLPCEYSY